MCGEMASTCPIRCASPVSECGGTWVGVCICTCSIECVYMHTYILYFCFLAFLLCVFCAHIRVCVHAFMLCTDWAGVLVIRKTTSAH